MSDGSRIIQDINGFVSINEKIASHTLEAADVSALVRMNLGSATTVTLPNETTYPFDSIRIFTINRKGVGQVLFAEEAGLTVYGGITEIADTATTTGGTVTIIQTGVNEYVINGKEV